MGYDGCNLIFYKVWQRSIEKIFVGWNKGVLNDFYVIGYDYGLQMEKK